MNVAIVGCGLVGGKRARALGAAQLVATLQGAPGVAAADIWVI